MNKVSRNACKFCRYKKCKATGMEDKWVLSAYKVKAEEKSGLEKSHECDLYKYDIEETKKLVDEMRRKETFSNDIDRKVINSYEILIIDIV